VNEVTVDTDNSAMHINGVEDAPGRDCPRHTRRPARRCLVHGGDEVVEGESGRVRWGRSGDGDRWSGRTSAGDLQRLRATTNELGSSLDRYRKATKLTLSTCTGSAIGSGSGRFPQKVWNENTGVTDRSVATVSNTRESEEWSTVHSSPPALVSLDETVDRAREDHVRLLDEFMRSVAGSKSNGAWPDRRNSTI